MNNLSRYTLGLDLGSNSIGWALVDEAGKQIIAAGVRVFPEGVERDKQGGEVSKNEQRRIARGMRRQVARRSRRKRLLRHALVKAGLLPEVALLPADDPQRVAWEREQFQQEDPYSLRRRSTDRLESHEIGRVLMHLNQRRGFLSNRKADRARKEEQSAILGEISTLAAELGERTLGEYLADLQAHDPQARVRGRHTRRNMYEREFEAIWTVQQRHHPALLTEQLKYGSVGRQNYPCEPGLPRSDEPLQRYGLHGILFFQRPMYWPKSVVGQCELEPKQRRCPCADRLAQRCRMLQEVNNLRLLDTSSAEERPLGPEEREVLLRFLERSKEKSFDDIRREFRRRLSLPETILFNLERGDRKKLSGMPTDVLLAHKGLFGKNWHNRPDDEKDRIVRWLIEDEEAVILDKATTVWGAQSRDRRTVARRGSACGTCEFQPRRSGEATAPLGTRPAADGARRYPLRSFGSRLSKTGSADRQSEGVSAATAANHQSARPPSLARSAELVNAILHEYGRPAHIHIELAREIKGTALDRARRSKEMRAREQTREDAAEEIRQMGVKVTHDAIDRYLLWQEQRRECIYSGRAISQTQLFGGEIDVDHILPRQRSLDNSLMNRVVCFRSENAAKRDQTPHEWLAAVIPRSTMLSSSVPAACPTPRLNGSAKSMLRSTTSSPVSSWTPPTSRR